MKIADDTQTAIAKPPNPVDQIFSWILSGMAEHEIAEAVEKYWPGSKPKPFIVAAMKRVADAAEVDHDSLVGWCIEACRLVYQKALEAGDFGAALRAIKQLHTFAETR